MYGTKSNKWSIPASVGLADACFELSPSSQLLHLLPEGLSPKTLFNKTSELKFPCQYPFPRELNLQQLVVCTFATLGVK
jgi:hypothetical protein